MTAATAAPTGRTAPLTITIADGVLTIALGVETLKTALEGTDTFNDGSNDYVVAEPDVFAAAVVEQLQDEDEIGGTAVHRMLDAAAHAAIEDGCEGIETEEMGQ